MREINRTVLPVGKLVFIGQLQVLEKRLLLEEKLSKIYMIFD